MTPYLYLRRNGNNFHKFLACFLHFLFTNPSYLFSLITQSFCFQFIVHEIYQSRIIMSIYKLLITLVNSKFQHISGGPLDSMVGTLSHDLIFTHSFGIVVPPSAPHSLRITLSEG